MITPAISVLSAVEGLGVATNVFEPFVVPITVVILILLFVGMQHRGTGASAPCSAPSAIVWFITSLLEPAQDHREPVVLLAFDPLLGLSFLRHQGLAAFLTLSSGLSFCDRRGGVYADMGHFGRRPIRIAWFSLVTASLVINYLGQGACC